MLGAAILGAENMIFARPRRLEPYTGVFPRYNILLHPKCGDKEAMNDILRRHRCCYCAIDGHVQFIDFPLPFGVLEFPHPLFADDLNFDRVGRSSFDPKIRERVPGKEYQRKKNRSDRPAALN